MVKDRTIKQEKSAFKSQLSCFLLVFIFMFSQIVFAQEEITNKKDSISKIKLKAVLTPPYVIGPGDQLTIIDRTLRDLFGLIERYDLVVSSDGYISIPLPDGKQENILAAGLTLDELSAEIREAFARTLKNPLVFIQINRYRPINVYIGGEVVKPGVYKIETATTSEKGGSTTSSLNTFGLSLTQAIQLAGGLKPRADIQSITVTRGGSGLEKKIINLLALLKGEDTSQDINLQPGDAIFVPVAENIENQAQNYIVLLGKIAYQEIPVNVVGQAKNASSFVLPNDATLLDALGKAGGLNDVGSLKKILLSRYDPDGVYRTHKLNVHDLIRKGISFEEISLRPNDTIELEASKGKEVRHFLRETGVNTLSVGISTILGGLSGFVVQDSFLDRIKRGNLGNLPTAGGAGNAITIIGGAKRITNENSK